jgi:organic radical activating enzyme
VDRSEVLWKMATALHRPLAHCEQVCLVDATSMCNMHCAYCYYDRDVRQADPTVEELVSEARVMRQHYGVQRIVLTGGEPTVRDDLPQVLADIKASGSSAEFLTNGIRLADPDYCQEVLAAVSRHPLRGEACIYMSLHPQAEPEVWEKKFAAIENLRASGEQILCLLWTIDSLSQVPLVLEQCQEYRDVAAQFRIRAAAPHWRTVSREDDKPLFASDIYHAVVTRSVEEQVPIDVRYPADTHPSWFNMYYDKLSLRLIHWPTEHNVDLEHMVGGPYYRARNGQLAHFIHSLLINQGVDRGWMSGRSMYSRCRQAA